MPDPAGFEMLAGTGSGGGLGLRLNKPKMRAG
jgi:hypothetical protein